MIAIGYDHVSLERKQALCAFLDAQGLAYEDFGEGDFDNAEQENTVAAAVASGSCDKGVLLTETGMGASISANRVKGIRCALCWDPVSAALTRQHNNANVLALSTALNGEKLVDEIARIFLTTEFEGGRHARRVGKISALEA